MYAQAKIVGISNTEAETAAGPAKIIAQGDRTGQWLINGDPAYHSTVIAQQTLLCLYEMGSILENAHGFVLKIVWLQRWLQVFEDATEDHAPTRPDKEDQENNI